MILQLWQHNCVWLCSKPGLPPWSLLGLGLWYGAGRVEGVPSSLRVLVTPTINQPTDPFYRLAKFENFPVSAHFATDIFDWYMTLFGLSRSVLISNRKDKGDFRLTSGQWEASLQSNAVSHWLSANLESALSDIISNRINFSNFWIAVWKEHTFIAAAI